MSKRIIWYLMNRLSHGLFFLVILFLLTACQFRNDTISTPTNQDLFATGSPSPSAISSPSPGPTSIPRPPEVSLMGLEVHREADLDFATQAGAHWLRRNALIWHDIEPEEGVRNWDVVERLEGELKTASENGQEVILIVRGTPIWAQMVPGYYCGPILPQKLHSFASFMRDAVARYSAPPYNVKYWELGNEPDVAPELVDPANQFGCWGDTQDEYYGGKYYAEMLKAVSPIIKSADPSAQVLIGGLLLDCDPQNPPETTPGSGNFRDCAPSRFLEGILLNEGGDHFDGISFHAYDHYLGLIGQYFNPGWHSSWDTNGPVSAKKIRYLRGLLDQFGHADKYLLNTETALICGSTGREEPCISEEFEITKAQYLVQSYADALANNLKANIWYSVRGWRGSGLVRDDQIKPAFNAYQFAAEKLDDVAFVRNIWEFPDIIGYEFLHEDELIWVLWASNEDSHRVRLPQQPLAIYDVFGESLPVNQELVITSAPIYVNLPAE